MKESQNIPHGAGGLAIDAAQRQSFIICLHGLGLGYGTLSGSHDMFEAADPEELVCARKSLQWPSCATCSEGSGAVSTFRKRHVKDPTVLPLPYSYT